MELKTVKEARDGGYLVHLGGGGALSVPNDPENRHYRAVQEWIAAGNAPDVADPEPVAEADATEVRLRALEAKVGVTAANRDAARIAILNARRA